MLKNSEIPKKIKIKTYIIIWAIIAALSTLLVIGIIYFILFINIDFVERIRNYPITMIILLVLIQLFISTIMTIVIGNPISKFMDEIEKIIKEVSNGNYKVRLNENKPLHDTRKNINKMISELDSVEILRSDFVNNFSHELKTPVVSIKGYAEELKRNDINKKDKDKYLDIIIDEANRLTSLSTNILNLSKIEKQEIVTNKTKENIGELMRRVILMEYNIIEKNNIELDLDIDDCFSFVSVDLMEQAFINIINNAIKFTKDSITIKVKEKDNIITCIIKDNGIGISEENITHIFDKFYTIKSSSNKNGNGIGLSLTKKIIDLHGADITVKSKENSGSEFIVKMNSIN